MHGYIVRCCSVGMLDPDVIDFSIRVEFIESAKLFHINFSLMIYHQVA